MNPFRKLIPCFRPNQKEEVPVTFLKNGGELLEELIAYFNGRHRIPIVTFSANKLITATNNFAECVHMSEECYLFKGCLEERPVLVKMFREELISHLKNDIVITSQMSHLKNVLKLIGCSLEFKYPAMVYEDAVNELLTELLYYPNSEKFFSWRSRLKVATDVAYVIAYLHNAFPRPVIYNKELRTDKVMVDQYGVTKYFDFSNSIMLPPGEDKAKDVLFGQRGSTDPEYGISKSVNQKTDVFNIGLLILNLLAGPKFIWPHQVFELARIKQQERGCCEKDQIRSLVDQKIIEEEGNGAEIQLQAFLDIALRCVQEKGEDRPDMTTVAKDLQRIYKSCLHS